MRTPVRKAFLSSTSKDLSAYRDAAYRAIEGVDGYHCVRMEDFGARDYESDAFCRAKVAECDLYIGIIGLLYGGSPRDSSESYTLREYEAAVSASIPRLMFITRNDFPIPEDLREPEGRERRQQEFRGRVNEERLRATFSSAEELAWRVVQAIRNWESEQTAEARAAAERVRQDSLESLFRESRAWTITRWQAAGVPVNQAAELADDVTIGAPTAPMQPDEGHPVRLIVGEMGIGKSLVAQRLFQAAIVKAKNDLTAPIPVYVAALSAASGLKTAADNIARRIGDPGELGASVFVDGADEVGIGPAAELLDQARVLVATWPKTTIVITSRPLPPFASVHEAVQIQPLTEDESSALISRIAGEEITKGRAWNWPESVRDAIRRPLFAIMLGALLREHAGKEPRSPGELISALVQQSLSRAGAELSAAGPLLERLAALSIDRGGGAVLAAEVGPFLELQPLLNSRLITRRGDSLVFPLPILDQWFAAQSLASGTPSPEELLSDAQRLERWKYPLIVAASTMSFNAISAFLQSLARKHPSFAAEVISEAIRTWGPGDAASMPLPLECGEQVRMAMQAWSEGIGPLAQVIAPMRKGGMLRPLGVWVEGSRVTTSWYSGEEDLPQLVELPSSIETFRGPIGHFSFHGGTTGGQPAWAWRWALDELVGSLSSLVRERRFPVTEGPVREERIWLTAQALLNLGSLDFRPILLEELEKALSRLPYGTVLAGGHHGREYDLEPLRAEVARLARVGQRELLPPFPGPDKTPAAGRFVWDVYSANRILARANAVYTAAIDVYQSLAYGWLQSLAERMRLAVTLPGILVGDIVVHPGKGYENQPILYAHIQPLPKGNESRVEFQLRETPQDPDFERLSSELKSARPEARSWLWPIVYSSTLDFYFGNAATEIAYKWVEADLKDIGWLH